MGKALPASAPQGFKAVAPLLLAIAPHAEHIAQFLVTLWHGCQGRRGGVNWASSGGVAAQAQPPRQPL